MRARTGLLLIVGTSLLGCLPTISLDEYSQGEPAASEPEPNRALNDDRTPSVERVESPGAETDLPEPSAEPGPSLEESSSAALPLANEGNVSGSSEGTSDRSDDVAATTPETEPETAQEPEPSRPAEDTTEETPEAPPPVPAPTGCVGGVVSTEGDRCFTAPFGVETWQGALLQCEARGGTLARIDSAADDALISRLAFTNVWLGGNELGEDGLMRWTDGSLVEFGNWGPGQPDLFPSADCIEKRFEFLQPWYDQPCTQLRSFICEHAL